MRHTSLVLGGLLVAGFATAASAAVVESYEGFDYAVNTPLIGQAGGTGWNGDWVAHNSTVDIKVDGANLTYTGLPASTGIGLYADAFRMARRSFATSDVTDGVYYIGALFNASSANQSFGIRLSPNYGDGTNPPFKAAFGVFGGTAGITSDWSSPLVGTNGGTVALNTTYLFVAKVDSINETLSVYLNPTAGAAEPATASFSATFGSNGLDGIGSLTAGGMDGRGTIDEIRVGNTFASVTGTAAVPEPATLGVLGVGSAALMLRRRK